MSHPEAIREWTWYAGLLRNGQDVLFENDTLDPTLQISEFPQLIQYRRITAVKIEKQGVGGTSVIFVKSWISNDEWCRGVMARELFCSIQQPSQEMIKGIKEFWGQKVILQAKASDLRKI